MAEKTAETPEVANSLAEPLSADKFQGFAVKDGEVTAAEKPTKVAKPAKAEREKDDADADDGDDDDGDGEQTETPRQSSRSAKERIGKAVAKQRIAERRADAAEAKLDAMDRRMAALEAGKPLTAGNTAPKRDPNAPSPADYENGDIDARYIADLARYTAKKATAEDRAASDKIANDKQANDRRAELMKQRDAFEAKGAEKYDDFAEVAFDDDVPVSQVVGELCLESDHGPEILYTLAGNLKEAKRVYGMTPARQAAWFGAREAELSSESSGAGDEDDDDEPQVQRRAKGPKTTQAPQPTHTSLRGNSGSPRANASTTDFATFERLATGKRN